MKQTRTLSNEPGAVQGVTSFRVSSYTEPGSLYLW